MGLFTTFFLYTTVRQRGIEIVEDDINCHEYDDTRTMLIATPMTKKREKKKKKRERKKGNNNNDKSLKVIIIWLILQPLRLLY